MTKINDVMDTWGYGRRQVVALRSYTGPIKSMQGFLIATFGFGPEMTVPPDNRYGWIVDPVSHR